MIAEEIPVSGSQTLETLSLMRGLMNKWSKHPVFVQLARKVADAAGARTREDETRAVHQWIHRTVKYRKDPVGTQWIQDPYETAIKSQAGNCANMATLAGTMLQALGHPCRMLGVWWTDRPAPSHAVCWDEEVGAVVDGVSPNFKPWPPFRRQVRQFVEAPR